MYLAAKSVYFSETGMTCEFASPPLHPATECCCGILYSSTAPAGLRSCQLNQTKPELLSEALVVFSLCYINAPPLLISAGVYNCVHPLWGGHGVCEEETRCKCDVGFVDRDSMGHPSCVPQAVLVTGYATVTVVGIGASAFL